MIWIERKAISIGVTAVIALSLALSACGGGSDTASGWPGTTASSGSPGSTSSPDPLSFSASNYSVAQSAGSVVLTVIRTGTASAAVSVDFSTVDGTALAGTDYTATTGTLQWAENDSTAQTVTVPISNATPYSGNKMFQVVLSNPSGAALIASPDSATVAISGAATPAVGSLMFSSSSYAVAQSAGTVTVTVDRVGGSSGAVTVAYATSNGTAMSGLDFTTATGTLQWADGDATPKTFSVPISNTSLFSGSKSFTVALSDSSGGATLGTPSSASVSIAGGAETTVGSLQFSAASYSVEQGAATVSVTVERTGDSTGAVSVAYATNGGTAVAGTNFTAASGTLTWAASDTTPKTISVAISNATPFSGSKSFTVALSDPSNGATLSNPSSASVAISGSGSGTGPTVGPSAVTNLQLINQGGPNNSMNVGSGTSLTNYQKISWDAATPGTNPIASYNIYRNGVLYAHTTALSYADTAATNSNSVTWVQPATVYSYNVAAVDTAGNVGPQAAQMSVYAYRNGLSNWSDADLSYGGVVGNENYASTAGNPQGGPYDISVYFPNGGFQPTADAPQAPVWDLEVGAFNYLVIDVNPGPTVSSYLQLGMVSRLPPGDVFGWADGLNIFDYGPAPVANTWATYKIPFKAFNMGIGTFTGSISGSTLTVTAVGSLGVDAGGFVTGPGVPAGTYITAYAQRGSIGTFTVAGPGINSSTSVPSTQMTYQRTSLYKFFLQSNTNPVTMYFNNMGFAMN